MNNSFFYLWDLNKLQYTDQQRQQQASCSVEQTHISDLLQQLLQQSIERAGAESSSLPFEIGNNVFGRQQCFDLGSDSMPVFCQRTGHVSYGSSVQHRPKVLVADVPLSQDNSFFEIEILSAGQKCSISIGLVPYGYCHGNHPGWAKGSIGYHADDGGIFIQRGFPSKKKERCLLGDKMGCGMDFRNGRQFIFFTKNGQTIAEQPFGGNGFTLFPAVGLNSVGEEILLLNSEIWKFGPDAGHGSQCVSPLQPESPLADVPEAAQSQIEVLPTGHMSFLCKQQNIKEALVVGSVPLSRNQSFFELEIFAIPDGTDISIALVPPNFKLEQQQPVPVRFCASEGLISCGLSNLLHVDQQPCSTGDKMGCGLDYRDGRCFTYFTRNSAMFGECEISCAVNGDLYPAVILQASETKTVSVCVQDCDNWGFAVTRRCLATKHSVKFHHEAAQPKGLCARQCDIEVDTDSCTARLMPNRNGSARCDTLIAIKPFSTENSYFELEIVAGSTVVVGATIGDYPSKQLPGWKPGSIGYHSDDGGIYIEQPIARMFVSKCSDGDSLGCGVSEDGDSKTVYFTHNGSTVTQMCFGDDCKLLYPAFGLLAKQEPVVVYIADLASSSLWHPIIEQSQASSSVASGCAQPSIGAAEQDATTDDVMEKVSKELQCPICWGTLRQPKLLPCCQHTFCLDCMVDYIRGFQHAPGQMPCCPVCRKTFAVPHGGAANLENNQIASRLLEIICMTSR